MRQIADSRSARITNYSVASSIQSSWSLNRVLCLDGSSHWRRPCSPSMIWSNHLTLLSHQLTEVLDMLPRNTVSDQKCRFIVKPREFVRVDSRGRVKSVISKFGEEVGRLASWVKGNPSILVGVVGVNLESTGRRVRVAGSSSRRSYPL